MVSVRGGLVEGIGPGLCLGTWRGLKDVLDFLGESFFYVQEAWVNNCFFGQMSH
jgi:hypothetical protein